MNNILRIIFSMLAMVFVAQQPLYAQNTTASTDPDVIVYIVYRPPQVKFSPDGSLEGEWVDKISEFLDKADLSYVIQNIPWQRAYLETLEKDNILISILDRTKEREDSFHWLLPITTLTYSLLAYNRPDLKNATLEQILEGRGEATCLKAATTCDMLRALGFPEDRIWEFADFSGVNVASLFIERRAAFILDDYVLLSERIAGLGLPESSLINLFDVNTITSYLAAGKNINPDILEKLLKAQDAGVISE